MAKAPPSFDFFMNDWLGGVQHLSPADERHYLRLLIWQWNNGYLPDLKARMAVCGIHDVVKWERVWLAISDKFQPVDATEICDYSGEPTTVLVNPKLHEMRQQAVPAYQKRVQRNRQNGGKGGRPRKPGKNPVGSPEKPKRNPVGFQNGENKNPVGSKKKPTSEGGREREEVLHKGSPKTLERPNGSERSEAASVKENSLSHPPVSAPSRALALDEKYRESFDRWLAYRADRLNRLEIDQVTAAVIEAEFVRAASEHTPEYVAERVHASILGECRSNVPWWSPRRSSSKASSGAAESPPEDDGPPNIRDLVKQGILPPPPPKDPKIAQMEQRRREVYDARFAGN